MSTECGGNVLRTAIIVATVTALLLWYGVSNAADAQLMVDIIECESSGRHNAVGDDGVSVGIAQFQEATFNEMKRLAHMPNLRWKNPIHQMRLMVWALDNGYGNRWTCYRKLANKRTMDSIRGVK